MVWIVLGAVFLIVLNLPLPVLRRAKMGLREGLAPLQRALSGLTHGLEKRLSDMRHAGDLAEENRKMVEELTRLRNEALQLRALERENADLRVQLGFAQRSERALVACEVIARGDISSWWQTVRLGEGSAERVTTNLAVITHDGLIGKTTDVSRHTSDVLLLVDPNCKASARLPRVDSFGIVRGAGVSLRGEAACRMDFIDKDADVRPGDEVVTSGLGPVFPAGLLIGYVERAHRAESGLYQSADIVPAADMAALRYVFVVQAEDRQPPAEPVAEQDP